MKPFYRDVVREAWKLSRSRFFLWPLAFLSSLVGIAGTFQVFFDIANADQQLDTLTGFFTEGDLITSVFVSWSQSFDQIPWLELTSADIPLVIFFFLILIIALATTVLIISSEAGLIHAFSQLIAKKKSTFLKSFRVGIDNFWSIFIINLLYRLLYLIILGAIILPLIYIILQTDSASRLLLSVIVYLVLAPLVIILDLVARYSMMYIVIHNQSIPESFKNGWLLFRADWIISIETALLILATLFGGFLVLSILIVPMLSLFFSIFAAILSFSQVALWFATIITVMALIIVVVFFVTVFTALQMGIWVGVFSRITSNEKHHSKTHRLTKHLDWLHKHFV